MSVHVQTSSTIRSTAGRLSLVVEMTESKVDAVRLELQRPDQAAPVELKGLVEADLFSLAEAANNAIRAAGEIKFSAEQAAGVVNA